MRPVDAWAPYQPSSTRPWNLPWAGHLFRRGGFGANWEQLQQALADGPQKTIERLLIAPAGYGSFEQSMHSMAATLEISDAAESDESARLWLYRMRQTPYPLLEKMTLFWHDYFAIAGRHAGRASLMERHLRLLRRHALGRFDTLVREVAHDPATLIALGSRRNHKAKPAEQFAATLLRRYTVGPERAGEREIQEMARAFTGWGVLRGEFHYDAQEHDEGAAFDGDTALGNLLRDPATARTVVRRLYRWLISETEEPAEPLVAPLTDAFAKDYDIARLAGTMLRSNLFFSAAAYRQRVKSPVEYALSIAVALDAPMAGSLDAQLTRLGQQLLEPPTRSGWPGGRRWLNRFTLVARSNLAKDLLAQAPGVPQARLPELLLQNDPPGQAPAHALVTSPEFQLG